MAYSTTTDVQGLTPKWTLSATSSPTLTQVSAYIEDIDAAINVALAGQGITTPYTAVGDFLTWLGKVSADGSAARTLRAAFPELLAHLNTSRSRDARSRPES